MIGDSRQAKLQRLTQFLVRRDFAAAQDVLRASGTSAPAASEAIDAAAAVNAIDAPPPESTIASPAHATILAPALQSPDQPIVLAKVCPGTEAVARSLWDSDRPGSPAAPKCWLIRRLLPEIMPDHGTITGLYASILRGSRQRFDELEASKGLCHVASSRPEDLLFMDIETCGLAGTAIFLVGVMFYEEPTLVFEQYLARDYAEEPAILRLFANRLEQAGVLVTFNGKSFDMNQIRERSTFHALDLFDGKGPPHLDLLQESRRAWRGSVPNCRLQTLEKHFCGRRRVGDIPGWAIPDAYHQFVASNDARQVRDIIHHNTLDLLTMAQLLCALLTGSGPLADAQV